MTFINPLIAPIAQGPQAQKAAAAEKERQVARAQALSKNTAAEGDRFEHQVESADALSAVGDNPSKGGGEKRQRPDRRDQPAPNGDGDSGTAHIDLTA